MITALRRRASFENGFTLVELLVVILIIAILAAAATMAFLSQQDKARQSVGEQDLELAFKSAKAENVTNDAKYTGGPRSLTVTDLRALVASDTPTITVGQSATIPTEAAATDGTVYFVEGTSGHTGSGSTAIANGTDDENLLLALDPHGEPDVILLSVVDNETPRIIHP